MQVELNDGTEFAGGEFAFAYDAEQMSPRSLSLTELTHQFNIESNQDIPGIFFVSLASNEAIGANGTILELEFDINHGHSNVDLASIRLNDATGRDFVTSALQRKIELRHSQMAAQLYPIELGRATALREQIH